MIQERLKIGEVAMICGLSVKTIRYYAELDLLTPCLQRGHSGYRLFQDSVFNRLAFIKRAQSLGLSLKEIKQILSVHDAGEIPCGIIKERLEEKLAAIAEKIEALSTLQEELQGILSGWQDFSQKKGQMGTICPNIQSE